MKVARVGILGAGTMGRGIAQVAALGGFETRLYDVFPEAAEGAAVKIREALAKGSVRGRWSEAEADAASNRIGPALTTTTAVAVAMGRTPIRARDTPGFVANRLARPFALESLRMLGDGIADAATIDRVVRVGGGFRMGPFELIDLIGLDVNLTIARSFFAQGGEPERWRPSPIQERLVAEGKLGRKSGRGYHSYADGRKRDPDPESGIAAPTLDPERLAEVDPAANAILPRLFAQIANEAAFALAEEIASPADMETATRLGLNWPLGPLGVTRLLGAARAVAILRDLEATHGDAYRPAPRLLAEAEAQQP